MADALRVGLIGTGRIGLVHAKSVASTPGVELAVVADVFLKEPRKQQRSSAGAQPLIHTQFLTNLRLMRL